ncbi:MAG: hypothetical protein AAFW97_00410 [Pseudomonadota bacterium]
MPIDEADLEAPVRRSISPGANAMGLPAPNPESGVVAARLTLAFRWHEEFEGSQGEAIFKHGKAIIERVHLSRFGETRANIWIRNANNVDKISVDLIIDRYSENIEINKKREDFGCAAIELAHCEFLTNEIYNRRHIAAATRDIADELGLRGKYMHGERKDVFQSAVMAAIANKAPYSVVRLGDGEGRVLGFPEYFSQSEILSQLLYYHFGHQSINYAASIDGDNWVNGLMADLSALLKTSIASADYVGLPVYDFFRDYENEVTSGMVGYGCAMHYALGTRRFDVPEHTVGTNVFQLLAEEPDFFKEVFEAAERKYIVGPWDLTAGIEDYFAVDGIEYIEVPRHFTWSDEKSIGHFPDMYKVIVGKLESMGDLRGSVFLIGAGILAKYYAHIIKMQGGVALDVGSVFDSWAGKGLPYAVRNQVRINLDKD